MKAGRLILVIIATILAVILLKLLAPKQIDWSPSFSKEEKIPYGNYILYKTFNDVFPEQKVITASTSAYEFLNNDSLQYIGNNLYNYIIINNNLFTLDETSSSSLLSFVDEGNSLFISAEEIPRKLADTLGITVHYNYVQSGDTTWAKLTNPQFGNKKFPVVKNRGSVNISEFDTTKTTVLGTLNDTLVNFVKIPFGKGYVYFNSTPYLLTNYYVVSPQHRAYIYNAMSYLPVQGTIWDEFYKPGVEIHGSTLQTILNHPNLTIAYYLVLVGLTLFVLIQGKRKQRIIPVITPYPNATLEFANTVGKLYYQHRDSNSIVERLVLHFNDYLRTKFYLREVKYGNELYVKISERTAIPLDEVTATFNTIITLQERVVNSDADVVKLSKTIEDFKDKIS